ncbi:MAG: dockerin type I repeat-containing protein [Clostridia bacterium]|nr:dockerin type I repeat-containing protein [Clostridia bacterium]
MKKVLSVILALSLLLALGIPVSAADDCAIYIDNGSSIGSFSQSNFNLLPTGVTASVDSSSKTLIVNLANYTGGSMYFSMPKGYIAMVYAKGSNSITMRNVNTWSGALGTNRSLIVTSAAPGAVINLNGNFSPGFTTGSRVDRDIKVFKGDAIQFNEITQGSDLTVNVNLRVWTGSDDPHAIMLMDGKLELVDVSFNYIYSCAWKYNNYKGSNKAVELGGNAMFWNELNCEDISSKTLYLFDEVIYNATFTGAAYYRTKNGYGAKTETKNVSPYSALNGAVINGYSYSMFMTPTNGRKLVNIPEANFAAAFPAISVGAALPTLFDGIGFVAKADWYADGKPATKVEAGKTYTANVTIAALRGYYCSTGGMDMNAMRPANATSVERLAYGSNTTKATNYVKVSFPKLSASAPVITTQPTDQTSIDGAPVKFTVKATNATTYQWYARRMTYSGGKLTAKNVALSDNETFSGTKTATLTATNPGVTYISYFCKVSSFGYEDVTSNRVKIKRIASISSVEITELDLPQHGVTVDAEASTSTSGCTVSEVGYYMFNKSFDVFETNDNILIRVVVETDSNHVFTSDVTATLDGATYDSNVKLNEDGSKRAFYFSYKVPVPEDGIPVSNVRIIVDEPEVGAAPDTDIASEVGGSGGKMKFATLNFTQKSLTWSPADEAFKAGVEYKLTVEVTPRTNYGFRVGETTATVNGKTAEISVKDKNSATVTYTFPALTAPDKPITDVVITDLDAPDGKSAFDTSASSATEGVTVSQVAYADKVNNSITSAQPGDTVRVVVTVDIADGYTFDPAAVSATWNTVDADAAYGAGDQFLQVGSKSYICQFTYTIPNPDHVHAWSEEWSYNGSHHWHECAAAGCDITADSEKDGYAAHIYETWEVVSPATTEAEGSERSACKVCGRLAFRSIPKLDHAHVLEKIEKVEPECTTPGMEEHYRCKECGALFADAEGTVQLTYASLEIELLGHDFSGEAKPDGENGHYGECARCGVKSPVYAHYDDNKDGKCDACGYVMPVAPGANLGDVNLDGKVDATDARLALRAAAKLDTLTGQAFTNADVDGNGIINAEDARKILRVAAKLESF